MNSKLSREQTEALSRLRDLEDAATRLLGKDHVLLQDNITRIKRMIERCGPSS